MKIVLICLDILRQTQILPTLCWCCGQVVQRHHFSYEGDPAGAQKSLLTLICNQLSRCSFLNHWPKIQNALFIFRWSQLIKK